MHFLYEENTNSFSFLRYSGRERSIYWLSCLMIIWKSWPYQKSSLCAWKHDIFCIYWTMHDNINSILFPFLLGQFLNPSCWFCMQPVKEDTFTLAKKIELLEVSKRFQGSFWNLLRLKSLLICCNKQLKTWMFAGSSWERDWKHVPLMTYNSWRTSWSEA
jgi:hypothetical protein